MFIFNSLEPIAKYLAFMIFMYLLLLQPLLRDAIEKNRHLSEAEAKDTLDRCLRVLYYRDARSLNRVSIR